MSKLSIKKICIIGLVLRLLMLSIVLIFGDSVSTGLFGSTSINDDVRYLEIADSYARSAKFIIDVPAFQNTLDSIEAGYFHDAFTSLWDWVVCVLYFILRSEVLVKIVNILFAVWSVKCIYDICKGEFGEKTARLASSLYAFLPYPVIFSCFLYKDQFYTLVTLLLIRHALKCAGNIKLNDVIIMAILVIASMLTRTGLVVLVVFGLFFVLFKKGGYKIKWSTILVVLPIILIIGWYVVSLSWEPMQRKLLAYVYEYNLDSEKDTIGFFAIKSPDQLWKYPFSLLFLLFQPLQLSLSQINCWMDVAGYLNIVAVPVAIGNILYLGNIKIKKTYLYWLTQAFYLVTIITSLGIVRHQYYLQPFMMIIFANYYYQTKNKFILTTSSVVFCVSLITYWIIQI